MSAPLYLVPKPRKAYRRLVPSVEVLKGLPIANCGEFELNDKEVRQTRSLIYSINKQGEFRYRTMREGRYLQVWRIK